MQSLKKREFDGPENFLNFCALIFQDICRDEKVPKFKIFMKYREF